MLLLLDEVKVTPWFTEENVLPKMIIVNGRERSLDVLVREWEISPIEIDSDEYVLCQLPDGWRKIQTGTERDDGFFADILDEKKRLRATVMAAPPHPYIVPQPRFKVETDSESSRVRWVLKDGNIPFKCGAWVSPSYPYDRRYNQVREIVRKFLPDYNDPFAYWDMENNVMSSWGITENDEKEAGGKNEPIPF